MRTHFREPDDFTQILEVTPATRAAIARTVDHLITLLDQFDRRYLCDGESEPANDDEPSLGWCNDDPGIGIRFGFDGGVDRELDEADDEDGGDAEILSWSERDGQGPKVGGAR